MAVNKLNGFRAPYRGSTFQNISDVVIGRRGLLDMEGEVTEQGGTVTVPPFSFVQNGLLIEKTTPKSVSVPSLDAPYFLTVSSPTAAPADDLVFRFAKSPADISDSEVVVSHFDGYQWRLPPFISNQALEHRVKEDNIDFDRVGPVSGLSTTLDGSLYETDPGVLVDTRGERTRLNSLAQFPVPDDDPEPTWKRVDRIVYRRPDDSDHRIGARTYVLGGTFASTPTTAHETTAYNINSPRKHTQAAVLSDNEACVFTTSGYGGSYQIEMTRYSADRQTVQFSAGSVATATKQAFHVAVDASDNLHIAYVEDDDLKWLKVDANGNTVAGPTTLNNDGDICGAPRVAVSDAADLVFLVYQRLLGPSQNQIYFATLDLASGNQATPPTRLTTGVSNLLNPDVTVTDDLWVYVAWENASSKKIFYRRFDDIGAALDDQETEVSGDTSSSYGTLDGVARAPRIRVTDNKSVVIGFLQEKAPAVDGLAVWRDGSAVLEDWLTTSNHFTHFDLEVSHGLNAVHALIGQSGRLDYVKIEGHTKVFELQVGSTGSQTAALVRDRTGSLLHTWEEPSPGTYTTRESNVPVAHIGPTTVSGSEGSETLASNEFLVAASQVSQPPLPEEQATISGSSQGNDGVYTVTEVRTASIGAVDDHYVLAVGSTFTAESPATGVDLALAEPDGNDAKFAKSVSEIEASGYTSETLPTDILLARIVHPGNVVLNYSIGGAVPGLDRYVPFGASVQIGWSSDQLTLAGGLKVQDLVANEVYSISDGTYNVADGEALYVVLDDSDLSPTPAAAPFEHLPFGSPIRILGINKGGEFNAALLGHGGVGQLDDGEQVIFGEDLDQGLRSKLGFQDETTIQDYSSTIAYAQSANFPTAISHIDRMAGQGLRSRLVRGKIGWGTTTTGELEVLEDCFVQVPGLAEARNKVAVQSIALADGEVAYVQVNRLTGAADSHTILKAAASSLLLSRDVFIIARRLGNRLVLEQSGLALEEGRATDLEVVDAEMVKMTIDNFEGTLSAADTDSQKALDTIDRYFRSLQLREHPTDKTRVILTGATHTKTDGTTLGQAAKKFLVDFDGAELDFSDGTIYAPDGTTVIGSFTPATVAPDQWRWYSVALKAGSVQADNRIGVTFEVTPAESDGASRTAAPRADFKGDVRIGQIPVKRNSGDTDVESILQDHMVQLGVGSGSGAGGGGDPSFTLSSLSGPVATLNGGEMQTEGGLNLVSGSGTDSGGVGFNAELDLDLSHILGIHIDWRTSDQYSVTIRTTDGGVADLVTFPQNVETLRTKFKIRKDGNPTDGWVVGRIYSVNANAPDTIEATSDNQIPFSNFTSGVETEVTFDFSNLSIKEGDEKYIALGFEEDTGSSGFDAGNGFSYAYDASQNTEQLAHIVSGSSWYTSVSGRLYLEVETPPENDITYYLCIDLYQLAAPVTLTDDGRLVTQVYDASHFTLLTGDHRTFDPQRYIKLQYFHTADSGSSWDGSGSHFGNMGRRMHPQTVFSPPESFKDELTSEGEFTLNHGLSREPDVIDIRYYDGSSTVGRDASSHVVDVDESILKVSSFGLTFGSGEKLVIRAFIVDPTKETVVSNASLYKSGWIESSTVTELSHNLTGKDDIQSYVVQEWDVQNDQRRNLSYGSVVTGFDDDKFYLNWVGFTPSANMKYRLIAGASVLQTDATPDNGWDHVVEDSHGSYATLPDALAAAVPGERILVKKSHTLPSQLDFNVSDVYVEFEQGVTITVSTTGEEAFRFSGSNIRVWGGKFVGTSDVTVMEVSSSQGFIKGSAFDLTSTGATFTVLQFGGDQTVFEDTRFDITTTNNTERIFRFHQRTIVKNLETYVTPDSTLSGGFVLVSAECVMRDFRLTSLGTAGADNGFYLDYSASNSYLDNTSYIHDSSGTVTNAFHLLNGAKVVYGQCLAHQKSGTITNAFTDDSGNQTNIFTVRSRVS